MDESQEHNLNSIEFVKKYWWIALILLGLPVLLNFLILIPAFLPIVGSGSDWLMFWVTYISSIASFAMVFITWRTLQQNEAQFNEMKKQWDAEKKPKLIFSLGIHQKCLFLKITNIGIAPAYNIKLSINDSFYNALPEGVAKHCFDQFIEPFFIDGKSTKYVFIGTGNDLETYFKNKNIVLKIDGTFCDNNDVHFSCNMTEIIGKNFARITDDLTSAVENIEKSVSSAKSATQYQTIQKSLHIISKSIAEYMKNKSTDNEKGTE